MAFGKEMKSDILVAKAAAQEVEIRMLREQLDDKKEEVRDLKESLRRTQDALIAKESPEAYRDQVVAHEQAISENLTDEQRSAIEITRAEARAAEEYISQIEGPLFRGPEDMISMLQRPQGPPTASSLHGDNES